MNARNERDAHALLSECCSGDCRQGRDCPEPIDSDQSMQMLAFLLIVAVCLFFGWAWCGFPIPLGD